MTQLDTVAAAGFDGAEVSSVGLTIDPALPFERWEQMGLFIGRLREASLWWIGAWINHGEAAYGEKYAQALDATGLDYGRLRNIAHVEGRVALPRRRDNLSFYHHELVAKLPPREQTRWLDKAEKAEWSGRELRDALVESGKIETVEQPKWSAEEQLEQARQEADEWRTRAEDALVRSGEMVRCPECSGVTSREQALTIDV